MHTHIHTHTYTQIIHTYTCIHRCIQTFIPTSCIYYIYAALGKLVASNEGVSLYTYKSTHKHTYIRTYIHTYIQTNIHTYIHTHIDICKRTLYMYSIGQSSGGKRGSGSGHDSAAGRHSQKLYRCPICYTK